MILPRLLQAVGVLALLLCANLAWGATPWGGEGWSRARLLYAGAGAVPALALIAIAGLAMALRRAEARAAEMQAALARIEAALRDGRG
ncbi:MAG: hypothetical protein MUF65_14585 [Rubritepida sp.]|nr:hypothetical protein [Rubritepida sp.]